MLWAADLLLASRLASELQTQLDLLSDQAAALTSAC